MLYRENVMVYKDWKKYEWLVTKIYYDNIQSEDVKVEYNIRVRGLLSHQLRQVDILITEKHDSGKRIAIVDCKNYKTKVNIKKVEEFIGMCEDIQANFGIIISAVGFTAGAEKRVKNRNDIRLETIDWETAYEKAKEALIPNYLTDLCDNCYEPDLIGRYVPGLILWDLGWYIVIDGLYYLFGIGTCIKCKANYLWCDTCGIMSIVENNNYLCPECGTNYNAIKTL